jgi:hypothetical protein
MSKSGTVVVRLPGGELYYESLLELDSDGSEYMAQDPTGQPKTSLLYHDGKPLDANAVPYFVLPKPLADQMGIRLGDVAAVIYGDKVEFAIFGDVGPSTKLGEGSIALHRGLGHEVIQNGKYLDESIDAGVSTIVFPHSGNGTPQTPDKIREIGRAALRRLGNPSQLALALKKP